MSNLKELEKKYEELGEEIERLKREERKDGVCTDCIFLLSTEEYEKYKDKIPQISYWWWLRSRGHRPNGPAVVDYDGDIYLEGMSIRVKYGGVRPALRLSPDEWAFEYLQDRLNYCGITWIKIDSGLYISEVPITFRHFDEKDNNYATSEIRQFLLDWYTERNEW